VTFGPPILGFDLEWVVSPTSSAAFLAGLARHPDSWVRESVAGHQNTARETLAEMVPERADTTVEARALALLAANPNTPADALPVIADLVRSSFGRLNVSHHLDDAGLALFERPDTPDNLLSGLLDDPDVPTDLVVRVASTTTRPHVVARLRTDENPRVQRAADRNPLRPLDAASLGGPGGLVERIMQTRRSTTGCIYADHILTPLEHLLAGIDDVAYQAALDAVALDIATAYDRGLLTFADADELSNAVWSHMLATPDRPLADLATAVFEAFDAGEWDHDDGLDPQVHHTDPEIRRILDTTGP
jgi:hypothetical protein